MKRTLRWGALLVTALVAVAACGDATKDTSTDASGAPKALKVGILQLSQATLLDGIVGAFEKELTAQLPNRKITFDLKNAQGDNSLIQSIAKQFKDSDDDMFAVAGTPGIIALAQLETRRPIIGLAMTDPVKAKVAKSLDAPGTNVTGSLGFIDPAIILDQVMQIRPRPTKLGTVYDPSNEASKIWVAAFKDAAKNTPGTSVVEATIASSGDISAAANSLVGRADTWVIPPDTTVIAGMPAVGSAAISHKIPLLITGGDQKVAGVLASIGPDYAALGALGGKKAADVVNGADPAKTAFARPSGAAWAVNATTAKALPAVTLPPAALPSDAGSAPAASPSKS